MSITIFQIYNGIQIQEKKLLACAHTRLLSPPHPT